MSKQAQKKTMCPACGKSALVRDGGILRCPTCGFNDYVDKGHREDLDEGMGKGG